MFSEKIVFPNSGVFIASDHFLEYLPTKPPKTLYLDSETSSGSPTEMSVNPWHHCSPLGFAILFDDCPTSYYVDYRALSDEGKKWFVEWLHYILANCEEWVNHNIKYDAHVIQNYLGIDIIGLTCKLVDTLTLAKLLDSDRITGYSLDVLCTDWLQHDITFHEKRLAPFLGRTNKDYGAIPSDILGEYACDDVIANRMLYKYIKKHLPQQCEWVAENEIVLTRNLLKLECNGMRVDKPAVKIAAFKAYNRMNQIDRELEEIVGFSFRPNVSDDLYEVLCIKYGLPILAYTTDQKTKQPTSNPSFDKHALKLYKARPDAPKHLIELVEEYKTLQQTCSLFLEPWQEQAIEYLDACDTVISVLHASYNQCVRTGRMSCSDPNLQQCSKVVKKLLIPKPGYAFISIDYSQIEFRFIVHYIKAVKIIEAYLANPDEDFHKIVAALCEIKRKPAKTVNFGVAFGEGKRKLTKQLATDPDIVGVISDQVLAMVERGEIESSQIGVVFNKLAETRAIQVLDRYHKMLPTLKQTAKDVEKALRQKGYVFNMYGRHRHLDKKFAYRGFNTLNQSSAADLMKERTNAVCAVIEGTAIETKAIVHDELLLEAPIDIAYDPRTARDLVAILESPIIEDRLRVPIRCAIGISSKNWYEACSDEVQKPLSYNKSEAENLAWLKCSTA